MLRFYNITSNTLFNKGRISISGLRFLSDGNLAQKSLIYLIGSLAEKASQLLLIPLYTRILSIDEYGYYGTAIAILGVLIPIIDLGISSSLVRFIHEYYDMPKRLNAYLKLSFWLRITSSVFITSIVGVSLYFLVDELSELANFRLEAIVWLVFLALGTAMSEFVCSYYRAFNQAWLFVRAKLGQTALQCVFVLLSLCYLNNNALSIISAQALGAISTSFILILIFYYKEVYSNTDVEINLNDIKHNLSFGIPLIPHRIGNWLKTAADRVILVKYLPMASVGVYQLGASVGNAMWIFVSCMDMVYEPFYYRLRKQKGELALKTIYSYNSCYLLGMGALFLLVILLSDEIIKILAPSTYIYASKVVPLIVYSVYLQGQYTLVVKPLFYHRKTKTIPFFTLLPGVIGILANYYLLPIMGINAALWICVFMYLSTFIGIYISSLKIEKNVYPIRVGIISNIVILTTAILLSFDLLSILSYLKMPIRICFFALLCYIGWIAIGKKEFSTLKSNFIVNEKY